jgi:hypothetical protein
MSATPSSSWPHAADQLLDRLSTNKWIPLGVNIVVFALLAYGVVQWTTQWRKPATPALTASRPMETGQPAIDLEPMLSAHLFGEVQISAASVDPMQLPISSLNLTLTGVMARGPSSFAFLSVNGAPEMFIAIGQEVTAGTILETVYPDRIVLRRGASLESVLLKDSDVILPPGSIVGPGAEKIIGTARPRAGGRAPTTVSRDDIEPGRAHEELEEAPLQPTLIK